MNLKEGCKRSVTRFYSASEAYRDGLKYEGHREVFRSLGMKADRLGYTADRTGYEPVYVSAIYNEEKIKLIRLELEENFEESHPEASLTPYDDKPSLYPPSIRELVLERFKEERDFNWGCESLRNTSCWNYKSK